MADEIGWPCKDCNKRAVIRLWKGGGGRSNELCSTHMRHRVEAMEPGDQWILLRLEREGDE